MQPDYTLPQSTIIIAVVSSGSHLSYLILCLFLCFRRRPELRKSSKKFLADDEAHDLLQALIYTTSKFVTDALATAFSLLSPSSPSSLAEWLPLLSALSIGAAMIAEVSSFLYPVLF